MKVNVRILTPVLLTPMVMGCQMVMKPTCVNVLADTMSSRSSTNAIHLIHSMLLICMMIRTRTVLMLIGTEFYPRRNDFPHRKNTFTVLQITIRMSSTAFGALQHYPKVLCLKIGRSSRLVQTLHSKTFSQHAPRMLRWLSTKISGLAPTHFLLTLTAIIGMDIPFDVYSRRLVTVFPTAGKSTLASSH